MSEQKITVNRSLLIELKEIRDMSHNNITRFVGACIDSPNVGILVECCPKGSLSDILENDAIKLDWLFRYSLIDDIINVSWSCSVYFSFWKCQRRNMFWSQFFNVYLANCRNMVVEFVDHYESVFSLTKYTACLHVLRTHQTSFILSRNQIVQLFFTYILKI